MNNESTWRKRSRHVIAQVCAEFPGLPPHLLEKQIRAAYPFGPRKMHPYKMWLSEVNRAMAAIRGELPARTVKRQDPENPDQLKLTLQEVQDDR